MQLFTQIPIPKGNHPIGYDSKILSLGSCFAINIAEKLEYFKLRNWCNPFGILFHPLAIHEIIRKSLENQNFTQKDVFYHNDLWHCFDVHSELSQSDKELLLQNLNQLLYSFQQQIHQASHIIITYGTSWIYREKSNGKAVANCHKVQQSHFAKELLSVATIQSAIADTIALIANANPKCTIIFTVSPVRHIKDGFVENQQSKAHLITALHGVLAAESTIPLSYFPSYEIMMDELRDYRFYSADMLHPSVVAVDYIWEKFVETHIDADSKQTMNFVDNIQKRLQHKPFQPDSPTHRKFLLKIEEDISKLQQSFPFIKF